jgi:hypothetical protein
MSRSPGGGDARVILMTIVGPGGQVDVGVRSDATAADLARHLGAVIGISPGGAVAEHWTPPRPGGAQALRQPLPPLVPLADAGVLDGDVVILADAAGAHGSERTAAPPVAAAWERGMAAYDLR